MSKPKSTHARPSVARKTRKKRKKPMVRKDSLLVDSDRRVPSARSVAEAARQDLISEAAYYLAEKRGFAPGRELDDWLAAEVEVAQSLLGEQPAATDLH